MERELIVARVATQIEWWITQRRNKLTELSHASMAVNPFLLPVVYAMHGYTGFDEVASFMLGGHLSVGHGTGFGKLVDERILPNVFGTTKLTRANRVARGYTAAMFDEIDHLVVRDGNPYLLSVKAGRWTIQLTMAVQLNSAFYELLEARTRAEVEFEGLVLGVFYGTESTLTDKFRIVRGIETGRTHGAQPIAEHVDVYAGKRFWAWLNDDEPATQEWVLEGILEGMHQSADALRNAAANVRAYQSSLESQFARHTRGQTPDWLGILREINGD